MAWGCFCASSGCSDGETGSLLIGDAWIWSAGSARSSSDQYGPIVYTDRWDELLQWLSGDPTLRKKLERHKQEPRDQQGVSRDDSVARSKARRTALLQVVAAPHRLPARLTAVSLPHRPPRIGGGSKEPVVAAQTRRCSACIG